MIQVLLLATIACFAVAAFLAAQEKGWFSVMLATGLLLLALGFALSMGMFA